MPNHPETAARPPFLRPLSATRGLFFLHIPKTAGSFVTDVFTAQFAPEACATFIEEAVATALRTPQKARPIRADYASAHAPMVLLKRSRVTENFDVFTVLRDPLERLASHLNWMDRFNHGVDKKAYDVLPQDTKRLVQSLARTDPESPDDLTRLFRLDELAKARLLFNHQAGMIAADSLVNILDLTDMLTWDAAQTMARLNRLACCVMFDDFRDGLQAAGYTLPEGAKVNPAKTRRFRPCAALETAAARYLEMDRRIVEIVQTRGPDISVVLEHLEAAKRAGETARDLCPAP